MSDTLPTTESLIGQSLAGFKVEKRTEVYRMNEDGRKQSSIGFFKDSDIATAFAGGQTDASWVKTCEVIVIVSDTVGYLIGEPIIILDDEKAALEAREHAVAKLTDAERKLLGL